MLWIPLVFPPPFSFHATCRRTSSSMQMHYLEFVGTLRDCEYGRSRSRDMLLRVLWRLLDALMVFLLKSIRKSPRWEGSTSPPCWVVTWEVETRPTGRNSRSQTVCRAMKRVFRGPFVDRDSGKAWSCWIKCCEGAYTLSYLPPVTKGGSWTRIGHESDWVTWVTPLKLVFLAKFVTRTGLAQLTRSTSHTNLLCRVLGAIGPIAFTNHLSWQLELQTSKGFLFPFQSTDLMPVVRYVLLFFRDQSKHLTYHQGSLHRPRRKKTGSAADHPPSFRIDQCIAVAASFRAN